MKREGGHAHCGYAEDYGERSVVSCCNAAVG
jgi:hypothetical protein